jgi:hypothetical protein
MGTCLLVERQSQRSVISGEAFRRLLLDANELHSLATPCGSLILQWSTAYFLPLTALSYERSVRNDRPWLG